MLGKSDAEQIRGERPALGRARSRPTCRSRCSPITPSTSGCAARTCRCRTTGSRSTRTAQIHLTLDEKNNIEGLKRLQHKLRGHARRPRDAASTTCSTTASTCTRACRSVPPPTRPARCASARTRASSALDVELQGPRPRQPLRRRHELLPEHRRGEPVADRHRQRAARRRPPRRTAGLRAFAGPSPTPRHLKRVTRRPSRPSTPRSPPRSAAGPRSSRTGGGKRLVGDRSRSDRG